jgi:hypothetical protein
MAGADQETGVLGSDHVHDYRRDIHVLEEVAASILRVMELSWLDL